MTTMTSGRRKPRPQATHALVDYVTRSLEQQEQQPQQQTRPASGAAGTDAAPAATVADGRQRSRRPHRRHGRQQQPLDVPAAVTTAATDLEGATVVRMRNMLEVEELEDPEELEAVLEDVRGEFPDAREVRIVDVTTAEIAVTYETRDGAMALVATRNGQMYGGRVLEAWIDGPGGQPPALDANSSHPSAAAEGGRPENNKINEGTLRPDERKKPRKRRSKLKSAIIRARQGSPLPLPFESSVTCFTICDLVAAEELDDEDEFEDLQEELRGQLETFGPVASFCVVRDSASTQSGIADLTGTSSRPEPGTVIVEYGDASDAKRAFVAHDKKTFGNNIVSCVWQSATAQVEGVEKVRADSALPPTENNRSARLLSEPPSERMVDLVSQFLGRLSSFQERAHVHNPQHDKRSRRLVAGLHEVKRGLSSGKVLMVIVASEVDECKELDELLQQVLDLAAKQGVPVLFPLSRRRLGRVMKKNVRVSCVGVYSFQGANDLFKDIINEMNSCSIRSTHP